MVGNFSHNPVPTDTYALYNYNAGNTACTSVVHGRQHLAIGFLIVAIVLAAVAIAMYGRDPLRT